MKRILSALAVLMSLVLLSGALALPASAAGTEGYAAEVVSLINAERTKNGLAPLEVTEALTQAAQLRAEEITRRNEHTRPNGTEGSTVLDEFEIEWYVAGENAMIGNLTPQIVLAAWMAENSANQANALGDYTHTGVGIYEYAGYISCVQLFINDDPANAKKPGETEEEDKDISTRNFFVRIWNFFVNIWNKVVGFFTFQSA